MTVIDPRAAEVAALEEAIELFDRCAGMSGYGYFLGGDPRRFYPDQDLCSADEVDAWKAACEQWADGEQTPLPGSCHHSEDGRLHIIASPFGIGSYTYQTTEEAAALAALRGLLARLKTEAEVPV